MKALTLWQPYSYAVAHLDKRIENRGWMPPKWLIGQTLAIHAGKKIDQDAVEAIEDELGIVIEPDMIVNGAVESVVTVKGYVTEMRPTNPQSRWFGGPFGWVLADTKPLRRPVPCRGAQGLWNLPEDVAAEVLAQIREAA